MAFEFAVRRPRIPCLEFEWTGFDLKVVDVTVALQFALFRGYCRVMTRRSNE